MLKQFRKDIYFKNNKLIFNNDNIFKIHIKMYIKNKYTVPHRCIMNIIYNLIFQTLKAQNFNRNFLKNIKHIYKKDRKKTEIFD
jgi:hypothetical protein